MKIGVIGVIIVAVIGAAVLFIWSGTYNIAATSPHWDITYNLIDVVKDRSIEAHSEDVREPALNKAEIRQEALPHYHGMCRHCHGAPGYDDNEFAEGLYPSPPEMVSGDVQADWNDAQLYWIIKHGIKMSGMPAFGPTHSETKLWGLTALVRQIPRMTADQYQEAIEQISGEESGHHEGHTHAEVDHTAGQGHHHEMAPEGEDTGHHD
jgi:mono/diheme cytochrome c family protein